MSVLNLANSIEAYKTKKKKGAVRIEKRGKDHFVYVEKRFDPMTGEEVQPVEEQLDIQKLQITKKRLENELSRINELLSELDSLTVKKSK